MRCDAVVVQCLLTQVLNIPKTPQGTQNLTLICLNLFELVCYVQGWSGVHPLSHLYLEIPSHLRSINFPFNNHDSPFLSPFCRFRDDFKCFLIFVSLR